MRDRSFHELSSPRLTVRRFHAGDAEPLAEYRSDPQVARFQGWEIPYSFDRATRLIRSLQGTSPGTPGEGFQFAVALTATGSLIGDCYLHPTQHDPSEAELGFTFARAYQGVGYASEAVRCVLDYAFSQLALRRVTAITDVQNVSAQRLLLRLGFRLEGPFVDAAVSEAQPGTEFIYALVQEDWKKRTIPNHMRRGSG
jgi:aminoglycoside 6'-N-acetyltransferase